jgi:transposase
VKSTSTRPGDRYLEGALGIAALSVVKRKNTYFWAKYHRITARRGPMRALVSVEHAMVVAAWHMLTNGEFYREPGLDYYTRRVPAKTKARAVKQLESLGYRVTLEPLADTA